MRGTSRYLSESWMLIKPSLAGSRYLGFCSVLDYRRWPSLEDSGSLVARLKIYA